MNTNGRSALVTAETSGRRRPNGLELSPHLLFRMASAERHVINPHARADNPLSVVFDLSEFSEVQIADLIACLSRLYVAEGGHGLIIDRIQGLTSPEPRVGGDQ